MTTDATIPRFSDDEKKQVCAVLATGLDQQTAAHFLGYTLVELHRAMQRDPEFSKDVLRAEAQAELRHMKNVHVITEDAKEWKASVWWLERRSPERFGRRAAQAVTARQLKAIVGLLINVLIEDVRNLVDRERVLNRLQQMTRLIDEMLDDSAAQPVGFSETAGLLTEAPLSEQMAEGFADNEPTAEDEV